jgi:2'-5' RNA ligase
LRAFLSLDIGNEDVMREMLKTQEELGKTGADVKLVESQNLHFTVKFFGEISESQVEEIDRRIGSVELKQLEVEVFGVGAFPDFRNPRVVWAGVSPPGVAAVTGIAEPVIRAVDGIGEPEDHKFHPHITLARVRSGTNKQALARYIEDNRQRAFGTSPIRTLKLRSSTLTPRGPTYTDVRVYQLK